jgi:hypothetical protein
MGKGGDVDMEVDADIDSSSSIEIVGLDDIGMRMEIVVPETIRTEGSNTFAITEPIRMENDISADLNTTMDIKPIQLSNDIDLDIRPVVMDLCFKLEFGGPPPTCIRQPYNHHFGITLFGTEVLGFNFAGESRIIVDEVPKKPQLVLGGSHAAKHGSSEHRGEYRGEGRGEGSDSHSGGRSGDEGGLRIRLD